MALEPVLPVIIAVVLSAGLTIAGYYLRPPRPWLVYIFKPLTTMLILAAALPEGMPDSSYARAIGLGLIFSLLGDIFLMLPGNRFLQGLASFLLAHLCYGFAFLPGASAQAFAWVLLPLGTIGALILRYVWPTLSGQSKMKGAVSLYVVVIVVMVTLSVARALGRFSPGTLCAAVGALLFMTSDALLAINRFRRPFRLAQLAVLGTYFAGQLLIALST